MKTPLLPLIAVLTFVQLYPSGDCRAQGFKNEQVLYLDADGNATREKNAVMIEQIVQFDDTVWQHNFYRVGRPMMRSVRTADREGAVPNGSYITYNEVGIIDTSGAYVHGKKEGGWFIYSPQGRRVMEQLYSEGELIWTKDTVQLKHEADSATAAFKRDSAVNAGSNTFTKVEIESGFPGGAPGWLRFLNKHLRYPDYSVKYKIQGMVVVGFIVDAEGHITPSSVYVDRSVEYNIDHEAVRIIFASPEWVPAVQNGRNVKSYKKQPIIFRFG